MVLMSQINANFCLSFTIVVISSSFVFIFSKCLKKIMFINDNVKDRSLILHEYVLISVYSG